MPAIFTGARYSSAITESVAATTPEAVAAAWLSDLTASQEAYNVDDGAKLTAADGPANTRVVALASEGAVEWYADSAPGLGAAAPSTTLPNISRMLLPAVVGSAYALTFHPPGLDCATKNPFFLVGADGREWAAVGGVGHYQTTQPVAVYFAMRMFADGSMALYVRPVSVAQPVYLFERSNTLGVVQSVLVATAAVGVTTLLEFSPSPTFTPYVAPKAVVGPVSFAVTAPEMSTFSVAVCPAPAQVRDTAFGGNGTVYGTVDRKGSPANVPLRRRVRLHSDITGAVVRETWSDAATGAFAFTGIDPAQRYTALAYDHEHNFRAEAADNLTPEAPT